MSNIKDITFEGASLTGTNGADTLFGTPTLASVGPIAETYSMTVTAATTYAAASFTGTTELYCSLLFRVDTFAGETMTIARVLFSEANPPIDVTIGNASTHPLSVVLPGLSIGVGSIAAATIYRLGIHIHAGGIDVKLAEGTGPFAGSGSVGGGVTGSAIGIQFGNLGAHPISATFDDIRLSSVAMPPY
jgi:hypothetical protein